MIAPRGLVGGVRSWAALLALVAAAAVAAATGQAAPPPAAARALQAGTPSAFAPGIITTVVGIGSAGFGGDGGAATSAILNRPSDLVIDPATGDLLIADHHNHRIRKVITSTGIITTIAGNGGGGFSGDGGEATSASLYYPHGIALDTQGNLFIADHWNRCVRRVATGTGIITTVAGNGDAGFNGDGGAATSSSINGPAFVAVDMLANLFVSDLHNLRVRRVALNTGVITTVAGNGEDAFTGDGGPATSASIRNPEGVLIDRFGDMFIADLNNHVIRRVSAGIITTVAGNGVQGFSGDGGMATSASLNRPTGIVVTPDTGDLFIADNYNHRVRKVSRETGVITTVAGNGMQIFSGDGGAATSASMDSPMGMALDRDGNLYVSDFYNNRVRRIFAAAPPMRSSSSTATKSYSATSTSTPSPSPCSLAFRRLARTDLVGAPMADAPLEAVPSESACQLACCRAPGCSGYAFAFTSCVLLANVTSSVPNNFAVSGLLLGVALPSAGATPSPAQTPLAAGPVRARPVGSVTPTVTASVPSTPSQLAADVIAPNVSSGLVAHITFDGDTNDRVSPLNNLLPTVSGRSLVFSMGRFGRALELDSSLSLISEMTSGLPAGGSPRTFSAWLKFTGMTQASVAVEWGGTVDALHGALSGLFLRPDVNGLYAGGFFADLWYHYPAGTLRIHEWVHIAVTYDGTTLEVFQNSSLVASGPPSNRQWSTSTPTTLRIGNGFTGAIDDVRIYNRVLSSAELQALQEPGTPSPTPSPSSSPYCAPSLFRALPRMDLVGTLVGTALAPGQRVALATERACRQACCDAPVCDGFAFASVDASQLVNDGVAVSSCFLYANITQLIPSSIVSSGIYESTL